MKLLPGDQFAMLFAGTIIDQYHKQVLMPAPGSEADMLFAPQA